ERSPQPLFVEMDYVRAGAPASPDARLRRTFAERASSTSARSVRSANSFQRRAAVDRAARTSGIRAARMAARHSSAYCLYSVAVVMAARSIVSFDIHAANSGRP